MKYALIHDRRICQIVVGPDQRFPVAGELRWVEVADDTTTADSFVEGSVVKWVPRPEPVPQTISDLQFFQQLAVGGTITQAEALAAVKVGTIPATLQGIVDGLSDPAQKFAANMRLAGATVFERSHPLTEAIGAAQGMSSEQVDDFFRAASAL
jgi:hypothetical protein